MVTTLPIGTYELDNALLDGVRSTGKPGLNIYVPQQPVIVLGRSNKVELELFEDAVLKDGVEVWRRKAGGGAVVLDPGNVVVSVAVPSKGIGHIDFYVDRITTWFLAGLESVGIQGVRREGYSDLVIGDRKVSGSCMFNSRELFYYSATLLCKPDIALMERYLRHPPKEPDYRNGRPHRDFVRDLQQFPAAVSAEALANRLLHTMNAPEL